jgi:F-type H+-transporting ATPase subunit gamma
MASLLEIKKKIVGVKNTRKITKAMQLVAASKMQYFQKRALSMRNYIQDLLDLLEVNMSHNATSIYTQKTTEGTKTLFVLYTSDKGLCGPLNTKLTNALVRSEEWNNLEPENRLLITIGKKSFDFAKNNHIPVLENITGFTEKLTTFGSLQIINSILEAWKSEDVQKVVFVSPHFKNSFTYYPVKKQFLPFSYEMMSTHLEVTQKNEVEIKKTDRRKNYMVYEPTKERMTEKLHEMIIQGVFMQSFLELKAAEYSSRMLAMKNATDAADKIIKNLTLSYNKARQQAITQEIAELVGASAAIQN